MSGLGWVLRLEAEGEQVILATQADEDEDALEEFNTVGKGLITRVPLAEARKRYGADDGSIWVFDTNHLSSHSEALRKAGAKVFGASAVSAQMEDDRAFGVDIAKKAGLSIPETHVFKTVEDGIAFLDRNPDDAFCFKPNQGGASHLTFVPDHDADDEANRELVTYLRHLTEGLNEGYILQARKKGVEVAFEIWCYEGEPFFATCDLESKRRWNRDVGPHCGCSQNIVWSLPVDAKGIQQTIGRFLPWLRQVKYTGFADANVIIADREVWFLEAGFRFPYSAAPNLFLSLGLDGVGDILGAFVDGQTKNFEEHFRDGFGVSVNLSLDHPRPGLPITIQEWAKDRFYSYDLYKDGEELLLAGYSPDVGVFCAADYTIEQAAETCLTQLYAKEAISFPDCAYRTDLGRTDYANAPIRRYQALQSMKLV